MNRRRWLQWLVSGIGGALVLGGRDVDAGPRGAVRRHRRRVRRRVRRRIRRRVALRMVLGRPVWVVPVGLAIGWELVHENQVVVVKETKFVEIGGAKTEVVIVQHSNGKTEQVEVAREDTPENGANLEGTILPADDTKTPGVEAEIEVEE